MKLRTSEDVLSSRLDTAGLMNRKTDKWKMQNWYPERKRKGIKKMRNKSSIHNKSNSWINRVSEGKKRENVVAQIVEEIMARNFPHWWIVSIQTQEVTEPQARYV